MNYVELIC